MSSSSASSHIFGENVNTRVAKHNNNALAFLRNNKMTKTTPATHRIIYTFGIILAGANLWVCLTSIARADQSGKVCDSNNDSGDCDGCKKHSTGSPEHGYIDGECPQCSSGDETDSCEESSQNCWQCSSPSTMEMFSDSDCEEPLGSYNCPQYFVCDRCETND